MDRRGRTERRKASKDDGLFPRYQGKTCDSTSPSGRTSAKLGGTAEVFRLLSQGTIGWVLAGQRSFLFPGDRSDERSNSHDIRKNPLQDLSV